MDDFKVQGLDEFKEQLNLITETLPYEKFNELYKIGLMVEREIKLVTPYDTGRLRASITTAMESPDSVKVGTNVDYAPHVNYGFTMKQRFLPAKYLNTPKGRKYLGDGNKKGIMLKAQQIKGTHFMEKGMQKAEPEVIKELENWIQSMLGKLGV